MLCYFRKENMYCVLWTWIQSRTYILIVCQTSLVRISYSLRTILFWNKALWSIQEHVVLWYHLYADGRWFFFLVQVLTELSSYIMNIVCDNEVFESRVINCVLNMMISTSLLQTSFIHQCSEERNLPDLLCCHYWLGFVATEMSTMGPHKYICEECKLKAAAFN